MVRIQAFLRNKIFLGSLLAVGFVYVTCYCFLENPMLADNTASLVGVRHPVLFFGWTLLTASAFFFNCRALYAAWDCKNRVGRVAIWLALFSVPVLYIFNGWIENGEVVLEGPRKVIHWVATIMFIACNATAIGIGFFHARKQSPRFYNIMLALLAVIVAAMLVVLLTIGKSGLLEVIPVLAAYIMLFLVNCTPAGRRVPEQHRG